MLDSDLRTRFQHDVKVTHSYEPRPIPKMLRIRVNDTEGREWILPPITLTGQSYNKVYFPLRYVTNRAEDNGVQAALEIFMDY
jgi:hypothetical protein